MSGRSAPANRPGLSGWTLLGFALLSFALLVLRRPASLFHADFWAEDGWHWYPDAYNGNWQTLFSPYAGYLQLICRIVGLAVQPFPLSWAPTLFSVCALAVQVATATLLVSSRLDEAWPHRPSRILFAFIYLLLPNSFEVYANLTNAQWHLSLLAFLLLVARPAATIPGRILDFALLALSGLSGPFCLFLLPVAAFEAWRKRDRDSAAKILLLFVCCLVQASTAISTGRGAAPNLGAGPRRLAVIVALQIIVGTILGRHAMPHVIRGELWHDNVIPVLLALGAAWLAVMALRSGGTMLRQFCLYAALVFTAGLLRPANGSNLPAWQLFSLPDIGDRYYLIPMLAWIGVLFSLAANQALVLRRVAYGLIALVLVAIPGDLHFATPFARVAQTGFSAQAQAFASAPVGAQMRFPIRPLGVPPMVLTKR